MAALIDATTGYGSPNVADWDDTTPQEDSANSGSSLENPKVTTGQPAAATGPQPYDDFNETNSAEDSLDSGSSLENPKPSAGQPASDLLSDSSAGTAESWGLIGN